MNTKANYTLSSGVHDTKGRRETMEDTHVVLDEVESFKEAQRKVAYYGCFDGHGGTETAKMIGDILHTTVFRRQEFLDGDIISALEKAFEEADKIVVADSLENNYMNGCTAVVGVVVDGVLHIANLGDSEGILVSVETDGKVTAENLTVPHKASVPSEKARIESLGGYVFFNRVFGSLAVSRAFGDSKYKQPKTTQNYVSYSPSTKTVPLNRGHRYLLLACDGLWDVCTHDEVAKIVHEQFESGKTPQEIASFLCTEALRKRSEDNVTVIITKIDWLGEDQNAHHESTSHSEKKDEDSEMTTEPNTPVLDEPTTAEDETSTTSTTSTTTTNSTAQNESTTSDANAVEDGSK